MRAIALILFICFIALAAGGCGGKEEKKDVIMSDKGVAFRRSPSKSSEEGGFSKPRGEIHAKKSEEGRDSKTLTHGDKAADSASGAVEGKLPTPSAAVADAVVGVEKPKMPKQNALPSGILTAGSFDDNVDPIVFASYVRRMSQDRGLGGLPTKLSGHRLLVIVKDEAGKPVGNARVKLTGGPNSVEVVTRSDGRAVFVLSLDQLPADQPLVANVIPPDGGSSVTDTILPGSPRWEITLPEARAALPKNLDLAIVLDTTGSMGDELVYLKAEIGGIVDAVHKKFPEVQKRFALVLYRDDGDEYVVRRFDFNDSLAQFQKNLAAQSANGGGDYPEAMHRGLEEANQLRWRENDTARVLFLIADAPPHAQHMGRTLAAANGLRKKGVAVYPVACSGYDQACEFVMRSCAMLTGSQFLFLTDDSGVGNSHAEPTIPYYQVERLERLMVRMITSELSGQHIPPSSGEIIRTVGRKVN
ncbi:MAG: VWA domain-containing protein [Planctomycetes bacterium]|nr:VWA domain-containing protein [Planctomycetota bacterium]